jgi:hypothetical protein
MTLERYIEEVMADNDKNDLAKNIGQKSKRKITFNSYVKKFNQQLKNNGRKHLIPYMKDQYYQKLYNKSGYAKKPVTLSEPHKTTITDNIFKIKKIKISRQGKTYQKTIQPRWDTNSRILIQVASTKPRSKEYQDYVTSIMQSTGRSRQAVVKKIQRTRRQSSLNS